MAALYALEAKVADSAHLPAVRTRLAHFLTVNERKGGRTAEDAVKMIVLCVELQKLRPLVRTRAVAPAPELDALPAARDALVRRVLRENTLWTVFEALNPTYPLPLPGPDWDPTGVPRGADRVALRHPAHVGEERAVFHALPARVRDPAVRTRTGRDALPDRLIIIPWDEELAPPAAADADVVIVRYRTF